MLTTSLFILLTTTSNIQVLDHLLLTMQSVPKENNELNHQDDGIGEIIGYTENKKSQNYVISLSTYTYVFLSYAESFKRFSKKNQVELKLELEKLC